MGEPVELTFVLRNGPFVWMIHPIYLPALEQAAAGGCLQAFEGMHHIRNTDATRALVRLLESDQPEVASAAALFLAKRLPVPNWKERPPRAFQGFTTPGGRWSCMSIAIGSLN